MFYSPIPSRKCHKQSKVAEGIEEGVRTVRKEVTKVTDMVGSQRHQLETYYVDAMKETQRKLDQNCLIKATRFNL